MADTIRILVATDNHVGAHERDPVRCDDSWKTFHEIMCLANEKEVDMVLLAGDLFHENKPSRKSMYNVMRSLRINCLGPKPCELEMLSDGSEHFDAAFDHVNYEDPDINVSIPVFSIHGNHDDPSGDGHYAALDLLAMSGLMNYFGKTPQSDNIHVKPVLLQKGSTKLALYGLSNVRDERLYRTFRDSKVKFYQAGTQQSDWFHMICVHQNHHAYTETSYLPENFLPDFLDLVIWGHEHECDIEPHMNPEMNFRVMQPGSSVATSLIPGEAVTKHVALVSLTGREFKSEPIRLKTVRPFVYKDLVLAQDKDAVRIGKKEDHRTDLTRYLIKIVEDMIAQAQREWQEAQEEAQDDDDEPAVCPLPLIRLRVETTSADGIGKYDVENAQRFSNRFIERVANTNDVIQFHTRKKAAARVTKDEKADKALLSKMESLDNIDVDNLVKEFLEAQSLIILPQNYFSDAVGQFVKKDDKHAMELFVNESLANQIKQLVRLQGEDDEDEEEENLATQIQEIRSKIEEDFAKGALKASKNKARYKPKPITWDSDVDGNWEDEPAALIRSDDEGEAQDEDDDDADASPMPKSSARGRGRGRGGRASAATARGRGSTARKSAAAAARSRKKVVVEDEDDDSDNNDEDVVMLDEDEDEDDDDSQAMFFKDSSTKKPGAAARASSTRGQKTVATTKASSGATTASAKGRTSAAIKKPPPPPTRTAAARAKQSALKFTASQQSVLGNGRGRRSHSLSDDIDDDDDDDAFELVVKGRGRR